MQVGARKLGLAYRHIWACMGMYGHTRAHMMPLTRGTRRCGAVEALVRSINTHARQATLQEQGSLAIWSLAAAATESIQAQPDPMPSPVRQSPAAAAQGKGGGRGRRNRGVSNNIVAN